MSTDGPQGRPFHELRSSGLLWLINATVFHPRGFALQLHLDDHGDPTGWSLTGDGREPWGFEPGPQVDEAFARAQETLAPGGDIR